MAKMTNSLPDWMLAAVHNAPPPDSRQVTKLRAIFRPTNGRTTTRTSNERKAA